MPWLWYGTTLNDRTYRSIKEPWLRAIILLTCSGAIAACTAVNSASNGKPSDPALGANRAVQTGAEGKAGAGDRPGKAVFARVCSQCHGDPHVGDDGPPLVPMRRTTASVLRIVRSGYGEMDPLPESEVSNAEVAAVVNYLVMLSQ